MQSKKLCAEKSINWYIKSKLEYKPYLQTIFTSCASLLHVDWLSRHAQLPCNLNKLNSCHLIYNGDWNACNEITYRTNSLAITSHTYLGNYQFMVWLSNCPGSWLYYCHIVNVIELIVQTHQQEF